MAGEKAKFYGLVKRLHEFYRDQLSAALISVSKFEKSKKYFIRALKEICPVSQEDAPVLTFRDLEDNFAIYQERVTLEDTSDSSSNESRLNVRTADTRATSSRRSYENDTQSDARAHCSIFETFFKNIHNFRLFRQQVKMDIVGKLRKVPRNVEVTEMQKRSQGELEALLSAWTTLLDRHNNLFPLVHPGVKESCMKFFDSEQEMAYYVGVLSVLPKLMDIANKIEFALTKYEMSAGGI
ncbi:uncharacterized protein [Diadema antillarum]|uniref:uncharacterized protein n=1 Tax=Diadema antillarum TaxID=105358 RepID=UPI003A84B5B0